VFALSAFGASAAAAASPNSNGTDHYSFVGGSPDGGSCGNEWANDSYTLDISVRRTGAGTFAMTTMYKNGSFVTNAGASPGACSTVNHHGSVLAAGVVGNLQGWLDETITSGTYNPNGCNAVTTCTTRTGVLAALFPGGTESNFTYNFEYSSNDKSLSYRHWQDKSDNQGNDKFEGDIANS